MKQTAVEWLVAELRKYGSPVPRQDEEQAKEMEKQHIQDAYRINPNNEIWSNSGIDYYNETFKNK
jgi:hypothetical protein